MRIANQQTSTVFGREAYYFVPLSKPNYNSGEQTQSAKPAISYEVARHGWHGGFLHFQNTVIYTFIIFKTRSPFSVV
jgi:hypothetical protein